MCVYCQYSCIRLDLLSSWKFSSRSYYFGTFLVLINNLYLSYYLLWITCIFLSLRLRLSFLKHVLYFRFVLKLPKKFNASFLVFVFENVGILSIQTGSLTHLLLQMIPTRDSLIFFNKVTILLVLGGIPNIEVVV